MKETLLSKVKIVNPAGNHNGKLADVLLAGGSILEIASPGSLNCKGETINAEGMILTPGWFDLMASFHDPGNEHKEDLISGSAAARNGGFTRVLLNPDTVPVADNKSIAEYILNKAASLSVNIALAGALSRGLKGAEMTEMYDLGLSGVKCFSNGRKSLENPGMLKLALQYSTSAGGRIFSFPHSDEFAPGGMINEGEMSTTLGIKAIPPAAEIMRVNRDLYIAEYCESPIHFSCITTGGALELIKSAKKKGVKVTCDVAYFNLAFNDEVLADFDSNFKVNPPLRSEDDRLALIKGLKDGVIDAVCTNHHPQNVERKECEFHLAGFGAATIETLYPVYMEKLAGELEFEILATALTTGPARITGVAEPKIEKGNVADLTLVNPNEEYILDDSFFKGKSRNNPWMNKKVWGKVIKTFVAGK